MQWSVEEAESINQRALRPINALDRQASWRDDQAVAVSPAHAFAWIITGDDNGYTYVTSTSWPHSPSSSPLVVSWTAVALLSGVQSTGEARR